MKKILVASTALVAASVMSAGAASASEKIKLELGGYSKWWVVGAWQDNSFQGANQADYNNVDIKGDNEVFFTGSTTLDNGVKVGINIELEAGGDQDQRNDTIDKSNVFIEGGFGKFIVGSEANGAALLHVMAPDAAGNTDSDGVLTGGWAIVKPTNFNGKVVTSIDTDGDAEGITYVAPTFYGLTLGATYKPNSTQDDRTTTKLNNNNNVVAGEIYGVGALYANTFGAVDLKVSAGWATYDVEAGVAAKSGVNEGTMGAQLGYAGFTLGGSYRVSNGNQAVAAANAVGGTNAKVWDAGLQYASGPYAISFIYLQSKSESQQVRGQDDEFTVYQVSGKYALGPGVDVLATLGRAEYDAASTAEADSNEGWAVMTGLSLAF